MRKKIKKQSINKLLIMIWNVIRMTLLMLIKGKKAKVSILQNIHPSTEIAVENGLLKLNHSIFTRRNVSFRVVSGELCIGTSFFNQGCCLTAMKEIEIGNDCLFGPNVVIVDHDHDFSYTDNRRGNHFKSSPIKIGNNVWVGANSTILRGSIIGDNCVIGAGVTLKGVIPPNSIVKSDKAVEIQTIQGRG